MAQKLIANGFNEARPRKASGAFNAEDIAGSARLSEFQLNADHRAERFSARLWDRLASAFL
jgi:hypothetical protein